MPPLFVWNVFNTVSIFLGKKRKTNSFYFLITAFLFNVITWWQYRCYSFNIGYIDEILEISVRRIIHLLNRRVLRWRWHSLKGPSLWREAANKPSQSQKSWPRRYRNLWLKCQRWSAVRIITFYLSYRRFILSCMILVSVVVRTGRVNEQNIH